MQTRVLDDTAAGNHQAKWLVADVVRPACFGVGGGVGGGVGRRGWAAGLATVKG